MCLDSMQFPVSPGFHRALLPGARERGREVTRMLRFFARLRREEGQAMVEYALILALVSIVAIAALTLIGGQVDAAFDYIGAALDAAVP
jgi:pilus assembly protein Flp/PilA